MSTVTLRDAKSGFSAFVDEAMKGEIVTITRHGKPVAALVSIEAAEVVRQDKRKSCPNFGEYLMTFPGGVDFERNASKMRDIRHFEGLSPRYQCHFQIRAREVRSTRYAGHLDARKG
ncbi:MAG: type II toxin-antitoxin system Phd/YefM family antitoxin [Pirellulales bacterium]